MTWSLIHLKCLVFNYMNTEKKIPKIIHYVWVGDSNLSPLAKQSIVSWKKYLPDYELKFWDETNSPMQHHYVQTMYARKKWAFVADYIRFWALKNEGGIYLDTDTEVLKSFDDLLNYGAFFGQTKDGVTAAGVIGSIPNHPAIVAMLNEYEKDVTKNTIRTSPMIVTDVLNLNKYDDVKVFDYRYFNPCDDGEKRTSEKLSLAYTDNKWAESWVPFAKIRKFMRRIGVMPLLRKIRNYIKGESL